MKNKITNFFNHAANAPQNTGGGNSQCQTSRSKGARQITARFEGAQMKNTSLISGCGALDVTSLSYRASDEHPMSTRSASDGGRWKIGGKQFAKMYKYVACLLIAFFVGVGNVWGATITWNTADNSGKSDANCTVGTNVTWTGSDASTILTFVNPKSTSNTKLKNNGGFKLNEASQFNNSQSYNYFKFTAPSSAGTIAFEFAQIDGGTSSKNTDITVLGGVTKKWNITTSNLTDNVSATLYGFDKDHSDVIILTSKKFVVKSITWTDAEVPSEISSLESVYAADIKDISTSSSSEEYITVSNMSSTSISSWAGYKQSFTAYQSKNSTSDYTQINFNPNKTLVATTENSGRIRVYWGHTANGKGFKLYLNGTEVTFSNSENTTLLPNQLQIAECVIPKTILYLTNIKVQTTGSKGMVFYRIEVLTNPSSGGGCTNVGIGTQPTTPVAATIGSACSISGLVASGTNPTYQWQTCNSDGTGAADISAAGAMSFTGYTTATLGLTPTAEGATYYKCVVSGDCGDPVTSNVVTVNASPAYNVSYNDNGKTGGGAAPSDATAYASGAEVTVLGNPNEMAKTSCEFMGWNTKADGTGTIYMEGEKFNMPSENITLYAMWGIKLSWVVQVNVEETTVTTTSTASSYTTGVAAPSNLALNDLTVTASKKGTATNKISTTKTKSGYISATFAVQDGYEFTPTHMALKTTAITEAITVEVNVGDEVQTWAQPKSSANPDLHVYKFADPEAITGTGTMKIYAYGGEDGTKGYRLGTPIEIYGFVAEVPAPDPSTKRVYMKCGSTWCDDVDEQAPKFYVYAWAPSEFSAEMTKMCEGNVYYADIPSSIETILFTRQRAASTGLDWNDNFVNQSEDITLGSNDLFTCTGWNSANPAKATFSTGTYAAPTFTVTYNKNGDGAGNDGAVTGNVPTDATAYSCGAEVTVSGNTGSLALAGYSFNGWNTAPNGTGTAKVADETYAISGNTTFYAQWLQEIPTSVEVNSGSWKYFPGQTITLTATPTGGTSNFTYQWQQSNGSAWENIGTNSATYTIENCAVADARKYRCIISKLGASVTSNEYKVHIFTLEGDYSGGSDWKEYNIAQTSGTVGTVAVTLNASSLFVFGIKDNYDNTWYRNTNFIIDNWTNEGFGQGSGNCRLFTGPEGNYTFTVDIAHAGDETPYVQVSLVYPSVSHPAAGYAYFKKWDDWNNNYYIHWWYNDGSDHPLTEWGSDVHITNETTICGTDYIYFPVIANYDQLKIKDAAGEASHYTGDLSSVGSSGKYFDFTNDNAWNTFETYTVTFNSNGGSEVAEQNVGCGETVTEPTAPTRLNYDFEGWQLAGVDYDFSTVISEDITLDAVWTRKAVPGSEEDIVIIDGTTVNTGGTLSVGHYFNAGTSNNHVKYAGAMKGTGCRFTTFTIPSGYTGIVKEATVYTAKTFAIIPASDISGIDFENNTSANATVTYDNAYFSLTGASGGKSEDEAAKNDEMSAGTYYCGSTGNGLEIGKLTLTITTIVPSVKLKVLGSVTQTISITVGEKLGEIFASGSLPTPSLPDGYTFKGWKNEANDAAVDNNTVTTGSMVIYADVDAPISTDATLSALTVNGDAATVDPSDATQYTFTLPFGTTAAPTVVATPTDANAVATVKTNTLSGATIEVVPESGEDDKVTYTITYSIVPSKDIRMVWKTTGNPCGESSAPSAVVLSTNDAIKDYLSISFVQTTEDNDKKAEEKSGSYLSTGKSVGNLVKITAKPGFAFKNMSFYGKIETNEVQCPVSIDGGETWTNVTGDLGSDAQHCDVFTNAEAREIILKNNAGYGTWLRHMDLTMIQACTPKMIAWTTAPATEYEVGKSGYAIAASANNGTVSYAASGDAITVNASTGALTINSLTNDIDLSASVPAGDGTTYCASSASVVKEEIKTYYLVTFDAQNETAVTEVKYYSGDAAIALPSTSYSGYVFQGWFDASEGGNAVTSAITPTASRTVYAQWVAKCTGPTITTQPGDVTYLVGRAASTLVAEASAAGEGELTYTWYACDDAERTNPVALAGAPMPSTAAAGTQYYYFTVTEAGCDVVKTSDVATITVVEKDPICIIKATPTTATEATADGACKGSAAIKSSGKKLSSKYDYVAVELSEGYTFLATDRVVLNQTANLENANDITKFYIFTEVPADGKTYVTVNNDSPVKGDNWFTMPAEMAGESTFYIGRVDAKCNPTVGYLAVYRTCAPIVNKVTVNGVDGTPNATNHIALEVPYSTTQSQLEAIAYTWASNSDEWTAAHEPVAADEWAFGVENTVTFVDKDGDESVYYVTVTKATASTDATLTSLTVNGQAIALEEGVYEYNFELPFRTSAAPTVVATAHHAAAEATVDPCTLSGATITVVPESGESDKLVYTINFSVSQIPSYVIFDGSVEDDYHVSGTGVSTFAWTVVGGKTSDYKKNIDVTLNGKHYTKAVNIFGSSTNSDTRYIEITIPEGYLAKFYLAGATNSSGNMRSSFISKEKTGTLDESIAYVSSTSYDGMAMMSDLQFPGTYYYCCDNSIRLYELSVQLYSIDYTRETTPGRLGTICLEKGGTMRGATLYEVAYFNPSNEKIYFDEVLSGEMTPGMPYVFIPEEGNNNQLLVMYGNNVPASVAGHHNGLYGSFTRTLLAKDKDNYIFQSNLYWYVNSDRVYVGANRAYLKVGEIYGYNNEPEQDPAPGRRRIELGNGNQVPEVATGLDETTNDQMINKLLINGQIFILRGEKMYDVTGKLVK